MTQQGGERSDLCGIFASKKSGKQNGHRALATIQQHGQCGGFLVSGTQNIRRPDVTRTDGA